ncbi:hypothetical protein CIB48_g87 [Xylaria polymorpha]|nr:hypothetical protein CIB48_g87 [Xylaria polymorpha]
MKALQPCCLRSACRSRTLIIPPRSSLPVAALLPTIPSSTSISNGPPQIRPFSVLNRPPPNYPGHVPLTGIERAALAIGSGVLSFLDPRARGPNRRARRSDCNAVLREPITAGNASRRDRATDPAGPAADHIDEPGPAAATLAAFVDGGGDRYRESHDFYHALTGLPVVREGEVALKAFEFANTLLPMTGLSVLAVATLKPAERRRFWTIYGPWAVRNGLRSEEVINVYWEEEFETDVDVLRTRLNIEAPPDLRDIRKRERAERKRARETPVEAAGVPPAASQ